MSWFSTVCFGVADNYEGDNNDNNGKNKTPPTKFYPTKYFTINITEIILHAWYSLNNMLEYTLDKNVWNNFLWCKI
jgi:hypothetical protein